MRILFDKSAPNKLIPYIEGHAVSTAESKAGIVWKTAIC